MIYTENHITTEFPDWYKLEKETEKTINKLISTKELSFYLNNSNEYIRRLAILRINELKLKDSIDILKEVLDDYHEYQINKELAAWTIKSISSKWDLDLFISHKLLSKYTGTERSIDINHILIVDELSDSLKFNFSETFLNCELDSDCENIRQNEDFQLDFNFSFKEWIFGWINQLVDIIKTNWIRMPGIVFKLIKKFVLFIVPIIFILPKTYISKGFLAIKQSIKNKKSRQTSNYNYKKTNHHNDNKRINNSYVNHNNSGNLLESHGSNLYRNYEYQEKYSLVNSLKKAIFTFFYIILAPFRLIMKHKISSIAIFSLFYVFLAFTNPGKVLLYKYTGLDILDEQSQILNNTKLVLSNLKLEANNIFAFNENLEKDNVTSSEMLQNTLVDSKKTNKVSERNDQVKFVVTAKKDLNLRASPDTSSNKSVIGILKFNTIVIYLNNSQTDKNGAKWHYVSTQDGKKGWASSKFLREIRGEDNE